jgi:hypothetical protein
MLPAPAVVETAAQLAVVDARGAAGRPRLDVIALAAFAGLVTAVVGAALVASLERAADGAGEPACPAEVDDPRGPVEHDPLDQRLVQQGSDRAGADDRPAGELADATLECLVAHEHADQRLGALTIGWRGHRPLGELHERVVSSLRGGARQVAGGGGVAVFGAGGGPGCVLSSSY